MNNSDLPPWAKIPNEGTPWKEIPIGSLVERLVPVDTSEIGERGMKISSWVLALSDKVRECMKLGIPPPSGTPQWYEELPFRVLKSLDDPPTNTPSLPLEAAA
ncbi:MAG: hypothetical protein WCG83_04010 [Candidatus Peregrinibacteria bacterium]